MADITMPERRAVVICAEAAALVEQQMQALVAEDWVPMGGLSCAVGQQADGRAAFLVVGVCERSPVAQTIAARPPAMTAPPLERREPSMPAMVGPKCPQCGDMMARRLRKADGRPFWGCVRFPECRSIINWQDWSPPDEEVAEGRQAVLPGVRLEGTMGTETGYDKDDIPF
jgi:hypothetical protein